MFMNYNERVNHMPNYKKMYHDLFNAATDAIAALQEAQTHPVHVFMAANAKAILILQTAQQSTEESYMSAGE